MKKATTIGNAVRSASAIAIAAAAVSLTNASAQVKAEATGLRIVKESFKEGEYGRFSAFNHDKGTTLALMLKTTEGAIIAIDGSDSKLDAFVDDKGTKLLVKTKFGSGGIRGWPNISETGKAAIVEIAGGGVPADGATRINARGLLKVTVADKKLSVKSKATKLVKDGKLSVGKYEFTIKEAGKPKFGNAPMHINLEIKQKIDEIAEFKFYKPDGTEVKASNAGSSSSGFNNSWTVQKGFNFKEKSDSLIVEVHYWSKTKILAVPFNVNAGVGLK